MTYDLEKIISTYASWLLQQLRAKNTQAASRFHVHQYAKYLASRPAIEHDPLYDPFARDYTVRDFKRYLKTERKIKPASINLTCAALDHFYQLLGLDRVRVLREDLPQQSPQALKLEEQKESLRAVERSSSLRDQALTRLLFFTGLSLSECASLNVEDILISARKGFVIVRSGKGETYREAFNDWLKERSKCFPKRSDPALFLSLKGKRLSTRAIDLILRRFGYHAILELSAHVLRHTFITNFVRRGNDLVLVAEVLGISAWKPPVATVCHHSRIVKAPWKDYAWSTE